MHGDGFFAQAFTYLCAAVLAVPLAKRLGLGSVLGYLIAGVAIGPWGLGLVGDEGKDILHFAEFGVVIMLFVVGLELEPALLWRMRGPIFGMGGAQLGATALLGGIAGLGFGLSAPEALAVGLILALSSTAIALQSLSEKGLLQTAGGRASFAVLLLQDVAVIPMLALLPLLATRAASTQEASGGLSALPGWMQGLAVLAAVAAVGFGARYALRPALRFVAQTRLRELFVAASLLLVVGIALLMESVGLSPALGTFLAGVVLADSEYRHELESDIEPFKGLLLGLFFLAVGASIDFGLVADAPGRVAGIVTLLFLGKLAVLLAVGRGFGLGLDQNLVFSFSLSQGGEFAFVLLSFSTGAGVLDGPTAALLVAAVALSMVLTPVALLGFEQIRPHIGTRQAAPSFDHPEPAPVIIAGYGRFGQICGRLLDAEGVKTTVLEIDSDQVDLLRRFGREVYYGDASRHDLLAAAGAAEARLLILALDQPSKTLELVHTAKRHFPQLTLLARARGRVEAYELLSAGVEHVYRETFDTALRTGTDALNLLGVRAHRAHRSAARFRRADEALMRELAPRRGEADFLDLARRRGEELEALLQRDQAGVPSDQAWDAAARADRERT